MKKNRMKVVSSVLAASMLFALGATACNPAEEQPYEITKRERTGHEDTREYTYNDYTSSVPGIWNTILTNDATNVDLASYMGSSFFEFGYKYDEDGNIVNGGFTVEYSAATALTDVTAQYAGQYGLAEDATSNQAFKITLRNDLKWDDGTPIKAEDFVYTMSQQLSPKYLFETADNYYAGNYIIHKAQDYVYQGQSGYFAASSVYAEYSAANDAQLVFTLDAPSAAYDMAECYMRTAFGFPATYNAAAVVAYLNASEDLGLDADVMASMEGKTFAEIKADATMKAEWEKLIGWWQTEPNEELHFFVSSYTYPEVSFEEVGYFAASDYELVIVFDNTMAPIDENGELTYEAAYYLQDMPLVKRSLWEANEDRTKTPWVNTYCTGDVAKTASWGPYKLTNYQADATYTLSRNTEWYGYGLEQYAKQFQTDKIVCKKVKEWSTAWQMFQNGEIDGIGMDVSIAQDYRNSRQAYFTPDTYTFSLNLQSRANWTSDDGAKTNKLLNYDSFRKAISLMLDRDDYCAKNNPSSLAALGLLNDLYYYDVPNGKIYRGSEQAKEAILNAYGVEKVEGGWKVGETTYDNIDEALDATTGYNLTMARELMTQAYNEAVAAGDFNADMKVRLTYGTDEQTENTDRVLNWFRNAFALATVGTPLEGKIEIEYFFFSNDTWSKQFKDGEYDLIFSAWGNAAFNPYYLLCETQISASNRYSQGWNPETVTLTVDGLTPDEDHPDGSYTFNLLQWSSNLQGKADALVNFSLYPDEDKLTILGAIETAILQQYYAVPVFSRYSASLISYKCDYNSYEYNTFMGYGGMRYMTYHFDDAEWAAFVAEKGTLNYKFGR
ncbi:MAG: hypothetical protein IJF39_02860 [Clostridia bacterium]|nr:hypothetical protein [Clostridia bacterium]